MTTPKTKKRAFTKKAVKTPRGSKNKLKGQDVTLIHQTPQNGENELKSPVQGVQGFSGDEVPETAKSGSSAESTLPPAVDKGVEIENSVKVISTFRLHWLTFTVFDDPTRALLLVTNRLLQLPDVLPEEFFKKMDSGSRGYKTVYMGLDAIRVYTDPSDETKRYTIEVPGEALEKYVSWQNLQDLFLELTFCKIRWKVSRLDLAFDMQEKSELTPTRLNNYLRDGGTLRCPAERKTIMFITPTYTETEGANGSTLYIGSRTSERFIRIYDRRGFTRVEMETKKRKSDHIARELFKRPLDEWTEIAKSFLLDYIDFSDHDYWKQFTDGVIRPAKIENNYLNKTLKSTEEWIHKTVSPTLAMMARIYGMNVLKDIVRHGDVRINERQTMLIKNASIPIGDTVGMYSEHANKLAQIGDKIQEQ